MTHTKKVSTVVASTASSEFQSQTPSTGLHWRKVPESDARSVPVPEWWGVKRNRLCTAFWWWWSLLTVSGCGAGGGAGLVWSWWGRLISLLMSSDVIPHIKEEESTRLILRKMVRCNERYKYETNIKLNLYLTYDLWPSHSSLQSQLRKGHAMATRGCVLSARAFPRALGSSTDIVSCTVYSVAFTTRLLTFRTLSQSHTGARSMASSSQISVTGQEARNESYGVH